MKYVVPSRNRVVLFWVLGTLLAVLLISACAPNANVQILSPDLGEQLYAEAAGEEFVALPTEVPPLLAELTDDEIYAGVPADLLEALAVANPDNGPTLAISNACIGCHNLDPAVVMTGPTWHNIGDTAVAHGMDQGGLSPAEYLHQSIVNPSAYVVNGFTAGLMPEIYDTTLSTEALADLIAYLLQQNGQP